MTRVIRWNKPGVYQQQAHRLLKKITEQPDVFTRNEYKEAVVDGDAIFSSNFKSCFKSMVSNQHDLHQVGIDYFLRGLRSVDVNKMKLFVNRLKLSTGMWRHMVPCNVTRHLLHMSMRKWTRRTRRMTKRRKFARQVLSNQVKKKPRKDHLSKKKRDLSTSHLDANLTFSMFIN